MPLMKLGKNRVFANTLGHVIRFEKDKPVSVPPIMVRACDAIGAVLVGNENAIAKEEEIASGLTASINAAKLEEGLPVDEIKQPVIPDDRMGAIIKGIRTITDRNDREEFTAAGQINLKALSKEAGFRVDKSELKEAMDIINDPD